MQTDTFGRRESFLKLSRSHFLSSLSFLLFSFGNLLLTPGTIFYPTDADRVLFFVRLPCSDHPRKSSIFFLFWAFGCGQSDHRACAFTRRSTGTFVLSGTHLCDWLKSNGKRETWMASNLAWRNANLLVVDVWVQWVWPCRLRQRFLPSIVQPRQKSS